MTNLRASVWGAVAVTIAAFVAVVWLHLEEQRAQTSGLTIINEIRRSRTELSQGFLHIALADSPGGPFDRAQGVALLRQALSELEGTFADARLTDADSSRNREAIAEFRTLLDQSIASGPDRAMAIRLRAAFHQLDRLAANADAKLRLDLRTQSDDRAKQLDVAIGIAVVMLIAVGWISLRLSKAREASLGELRRWFDAFENAGFGIAVSDARTNTIRFANPAYARMRGMTVSEVCGLSITELYPPEELDHVLAMVAVADREGEVEFESQYRRKDGTCFPIHIHVTSVRDAHGDVRYRISTPLDISELKRAERQLLQAQRMEAVGQLTGGIAHDFNNLLSIVIGNLDLAAERATNDPALLELIQSALTGAERGGELVRRLLAFARKQPLRPQPLDLNAGLPNVVALLRRTLGESIVIRSAPAPVLWPALVDAAQLDDAIVNLAINARDAMPAGGTLTIETADARLDERYAAENAEVTAGDYVMLAVSDTGTGMPPEVAQRAFEPFFTTKGESKGTGLGLSMVYGFVKQSGGHAKIYSELGHGTTVKLYLPRAETGRNETAAERASDEVPARGNEAILVVDDNADVRRTVVKMLHDLGYRIHEAERAGDALEVLRRGEPVDLLFTDIVMPGGMSGYELAREARALRPALKVVFTSGYAEAATRNGHALEPGERLLGKPYRKSELARKLREALDAPLGDTRPGSPEPGSR